MAVMMRTLWKHLEKAQASDGGSNPTGSGPGVQGDDSVALTSSQQGGTPTIPCEQKLQKDKITFEPTKGAKDIEVLPPSAGWEASVDAGKDTYKVGTDDKGRKLEFGAEYLLGQLPLPPINFTVRGIPCFAAGGVEVKIGTSHGAGSAEKSVKAYAIVGGKVTINAGRA